MSAGIVRSMLLVGSVVLTVAVAATPVDGFTVRWDERGPFLTGNLTWGPEGGTIVWGPTPHDADDEPRGRSPTADEVRARKLAYAQPRLLPPPSLPSPDSFVSAPLPFHVFLNVSRNIQVDLFLKANDEQPKPCTSMQNMKELGPAASQMGAGPEPLLSVELFAGDQRIGAGRLEDQPNYAYVYPERAAPTPPSGYGLCRFAIAPEVPSMAPGTRLTLRVHHLRQIHDYPYGLQADHASRLRIPLYPPEDVAFRYPELFEEPEPPVAAFAPFALLGLGALRPRRDAWLLGLVLAPAFAGCLGNADAPRAPGDGERLGGTAHHTLQPDPGDLTDGAHGTVVGQVRDDVRLPVGGVLVARLGSGDVRSTDAKGRFVFSNVPEGTHRLRFQHAEYRVFETDVEVKAGFVSRPSVILWLARPAERDQRPHPHDGWNGQDSLELDPIVFVESCGGAPPACDAPAAGGLLPVGARNNTILPGTREVEIRLSWDVSARKVERMGLAIRTNDGFQSGATTYVAANHSVFAPRAPGEPFRMQVAWEETDVGHQRLSTWVFVWYVAAQDEPTPQERQEMERPGYQRGNIEARVRIHRGALPIEAPHPDHWKGHDRFEVATGQGVAMRAATLPPGVHVNVDRLSCTSPCSTTTLLPTLAPRQVVPAGTRWVEVQLRIDPASTVSYGWTLRYKAADVPPGPPQTYPEADLVSASSTIWTWRLNVAPHESDAQYARVTSWRFHFLPDDMHAWWADYHVRTRAGLTVQLPDSAPVSVTATVVAGRT